MTSYLADAVPGFVPNTGVWTELLGSWANAAAGAALWVIGIIGALGIIAFIVGRLSRNQRLALGGAWGLGLCVIGAIAYGALASGLVTGVAMRIGAFGASVLSAVTPGGTP